MITNVEKLNELFSNQEFVDSINNLDNMEAIYEAVKAKTPEVTIDELSEYLTAISAMMVKGEISESELDDVAGGGILAFITGAAAVIGLINGCYTMGSNLGKFIGNLRK